MRMRSLERGGQVNSKGTPSQSPVESRREVATPTGLLLLSPLTPTLSLGEREDFVARGDGVIRPQLGSLPDSRIQHRSCSLSPRERVRVRGNERFIHRRLPKNEMRPDFGLQSLWDYRSALRGLPIQFFCVFAFITLFATPAHAWRSTLYPLDWQPPADGFASFETNKLIQDFSYAGYRAGEQGLPNVVGPVRSRLINVLPLPLE